MRPKGDIDAVITKFNRLKAKGESINLIELAKSFKTKRLTLLR
jgi:hypothetical protein